MNQAGCYRQTAMQWQYFHSLSEILDVELNSELSI